jgi:hypothetical protein
MPVAPAYGGNGGFGGFGGDFGWLLLGLLFGGFGFGGGFGGFGGGMMNYDFPWLLNGQNGINANTNAGFQNLATQNAITAVQSDLGDIQTQLCNGFAGVNATINGTAANAETAANARAMANMQQLFGLSQQFSDCCCENRLGLANLGADIAREACADRAAVTDGVRDIIANQTAGIQTILTQMCNDKIDAKNEKIADLERQLTMANLAASQGAQTAAIIANNEAQTTALEQYLAPVPRPAYVVQNPNCCTNACGCGNF